MKIAVLGAGIVGVTAAWELLRDGHDVILIDRHAVPASETSHANGGQISPSHADPWAAPGSLVRALRWMIDPAAPLRLLPSFDLAQLGWFSRFVSNTSAGRHAENTERMARLALYSLDRLRRFNSAEKLSYNRRQSGLLHIFRDPEAFEAAKPQAARVTELGCDRLPVSVDECIAIEPALKNVSKQLVGGFTSPGDESGDARLFAERLARLSRNKGLVLRLGVAIEGLVREGGRVRAVKLAGDERLDVDAVVCALGAYSNPFLRDLGLSLPVQPAKGYSITVPAKPARAAPKVALIDDARKLVVSRLGGSVRIAGMAEFAGFDTSIPGPRPKVLARQAFDLLPGLRHHQDKGADLRFWAGLRPQTPDGGPVIGASPVEGLYLNTGHGTLGWTMAMGSARLLADIIGGHAPALPTEGYALSRF
ncbi:MAG: D-amino acid dehydrogenase [Rhodospirillales bacterium]